MTQPRECAGSAQPNNLPLRQISSRLNHEAKMCARTDIFAQPSNDAAAQMRGFGTAEQFAS